MCHGAIDHRLLIREAEMRLERGSLPRFAPFARLVPKLRAAALAVLIALVPAASPAEDGALADPAWDFCVDAEPEFAARQQCIEDWRHAVNRIYEYGTAKGYYGEDGELDLSAMLKPLLSWRTLVGLPPKDPFMRCLNKVSLGRAQDFRLVWACLVETDPDAAKMDTI